MKCKEKICKMSQKSIQELKKRSNLACCTEQGLMTMEKWSFDVLGREILVFSWELYLLRKYSRTFGLSTDRKLAPLVVQLESPQRDADISSLASWSNQKLDLRLWASKSRWFQIYDAESNECWCKMDELNPGEMTSLFRIVRCSRFQHCGVLELRVEYDAYKQDFWSRE